MSAVLPAVLVAFLLSGPVSAHPDTATCAPGVRHIELPAVPEGEAPTICISPERTTLLSFDTGLAPGSITLEGADRFIQVEPGPSTLKLLPSVKVTAGERLRLTVAFHDNAAPTRAAFMLIVQAAQAEPLVNVYRQVRSAESYAQELEEMRAEVRQLSAEITRLRVESSSPSGLTGLLTSGLMAEEGVLGRNLTRSFKRAVTNAFDVSSVTSYRSAKRVAVRVLLVLPEDAPPWNPDSATLTLQGRRGAELNVVTVWPREPITPGLPGGNVVVEAETSTYVPAGVFTLRLWDSTGTRTVTISGITFQ